MTGREPRRVLLTTDAVGGVWTYAGDLARGLRARGTEVLLAVLGPEPGATQRAALPREVEVRCTGLPLDWTAGTPADLAHAAGELAKLARSAGVDLVHLHTPALAGGTEYGPPVLASAHSCVATWWRAVRQGALPPDFAWRRDAVQAGLRAAALAIAPCEAFLRAMRSEYDGGWACRVVRNGRAMPAGDAPSPRAGVLTAGRLWDEGKGAALLDRVAARGGFAIDAAGPAAGPNGARAELLHLNLLGTLGEPALRQRMRCASVFAAPALYEPFGLTVLEAAQEGAALVLSDIATFRELWDGAALFVPPGDADVWHATLAALLRDASRTETLAAQARERSRRYTAEAMIEGTLVAYRAASSVAAMAL